MRPARHGLAGAILPLAAVLAPLSILAVMGWLQWRTVWDDAEQQMLRAADSVAEYGTRTLESYGLAAGRVDDRLRGLSDDAIRADEAALHDALRRIGAELSTGAQATVVDRAGAVLLASSVYPVARATSLADGDEFRALGGPLPAADGPPPTHVSRTYKDPVDGRWVFSVGRRRRGTGNPPAADGFDGIVLVSVSPRVLAEGMRRLLAAPTDRMALVREDGYGLSSTSGVMEAGPLPRVDPNSLFHVFAAQGVRSAVYVSTTAMRGTASLLAMRRIEGFPVYAVSVRGRAEIVAGWWDIMGRQLAIGLPATLGLLLLSLRVARDQRRLALANADLRTDHDLSADRLGRAKRFGLVGTFEFDLRTGISRRSPEYMSVHGLPAVATDETHADWRSRLHPDDRERAEAHLRRALSEASGAADYAQTYRIVTPAGDIRWIAAQGEIGRDDSGRAVMLRGAHVDVTPVRTTELALAESDARLRLAQEAVGIGTWEWERGSSVLRLSRQMAGLLDLDAAGGTADVADAMARLHPADRWRVRRDFVRAYRSGLLRSEFRVRHPDARGDGETVWLASRARLLAPGGGSGRGAGERIVGVAYDVTERRVAEMRAELLAHEVEHRAKNLLAVVSGLVRMSAPKEQRESAETLQGRIRALGRATTLLGQQRWAGADLAELVRQELEPFDVAGADGTPRIARAGPTVTVTAEQAQPLCMALHELATNAAKYGALSVPAGRLDLRWWVADGRTHLEWCERGGPVLAGPPARSSFGSRLIQSVFVDQLGGTIVRAWDAEGLSCAMSFPVERP